MLYGANSANRTPLRNNIQALATSVRLQNLPLLALDTVQNNGYRGSRLTARGAEHMCCQSTHKALLEMTWRLIITCHTALSCSVGTQSQSTSMMYRPQRHDVGTVLQAKLPRKTPKTTFFLSIV